MSEDIKNQAAQMLRRIDNPTLQGQVIKIQNEDPMEEQKQRTNQNVKENIIMKKWIKADNGRVTQVIKFNDGSKY